MWVRSQRVSLGTQGLSHTLSTYFRYVNSTRKVNTMSWKTFHNRGETLRDVVHVADERRDGALPMNVPGVAENFTDELDLVGALLLRWHARLSGNIERALAREPMDLESAVAAAWRTTAEQMPGVRMVIDRSMDAPATPEMERAMNRAHDRESAYLATAAGLSNGDSAAAVEAGRRVEQLARTGLAVPQARSRARDRSRPEAEAGPIRARRAAESLADRIRAVLAA